MLGLISLLTVPASSHFHLLDRIYFFYDSKAADNMGICSSLFFFMSQATDSH